MKAPTTTPAVSRQEAFAVRRADMTIRSLPPILGCLQRAAAAEPADGPLLERFARRSEGR
jgi:hypothetical protein